jgi:hypothetical protein
MVGRRRRPRDPIFVYALLMGALGMFALAFLVVAITAALR